MEVYTFVYNPFRMGGNVRQPTRTTIEEYEPLTLGGPCAVFHNPIRDLWHVAVEACGAIVSTAKTKEDAIAQARDDLATADLEIVAKQIEQGKKDLARAKHVDRDEFFTLFKAKAAP